MIRRRDPFTQALDSLRARAEDGTFVPGQPVVIIDEARRLRLSTTPVREALAWLCGFGLIERAPAGGYLAPRLDPAIVRDRLTFRLHCLMASLDQAGIAGAQDHPEATAMVDRLAMRMMRTIRLSGNASLVEEYQRVASQLRQLGAAERRLFPDLEEEAERLLRLFETSGRQPLATALTLYHQRRIDAATRLVLEAEAGRLPLSEDR